MGRDASPYKKGRYYCTGLHGRKHHKLCLITDGFQAAKTALNRLMVQDDEEKRRIENPASMSDPLVFSAHQPSGSGDYSPLIATAVDEFLSHIETNTRLGNYDWTREKLTELVELYGDRQTASFSHVDANNYKTYWLKERVNKKTKNVGDFAASTINQHLSAARQFFNWMAKPSRQGRYRLLSSPFAEVSLLEDKPRERIITDEEWKALNDNVTNGNARGAKAEMKDILAVMRYTTCRPGEIRSLRWEYIRWDENRMVFPAAEHKTGRTGKKREMTILPPLMEALRARRARFDEMGKPAKGLVFSCPAHINGVNCASGSDRKLTANGLAYRFRRLKDRCITLGLIEKEVDGERLVPYSSRHTRITEMFVQEVDAASVQFEAGHSNGITTERYKHLQAARVADKIREAWEKTNEKVASDQDEAK